MGAARPLALVAGAGAGLGQSLLARFEAAGMTPVGLGRTRPDAPVGAFHTVDLTDAEASAALLEQVIAPFAQTTLDDYQRTWASMVQTLVVLGQGVLQPMVRAGGGTLIVSGATASLQDDKA